MAINKIAAPLSTSPAVFAAPVVNQLLALSIASEKHARIVDGYVLKGSMFCILGELFVADSDTVISGTESGSVAVRITVSGNSAIAEYVSTNEATWNGAYFGFYDTNNRLYIYDYLYPGNVINPEYSISSMSSGFIVYNPGIWCSIDESVGVLKKRIRKSGKYRLFTTLYTNNGSGSAVVYKNGALFGTIHTVYNTTTSFTEDVVLSEGDFIDLYIRCNSIDSGGAFQLMTVQITHFSIRNQVG